MSDSFWRPGRGAVEPPRGERPRPPAAAPPARQPAGEVVPFRRRAVKPRRRRRPLGVALLRPAATALLLVAAPVALAVWMLTSPRFALAEIQVAGAERVGEAWVRGRLAPFTGRNLLALPLVEVERRFAGHPWIAGVSLRKDLPRRLAVTLVERHPAVLVPRLGRLWLADREGRAIVPAPPGAEEDYLVVVATPGAEWEEVPAGLELAAGVARHRPVWAAGLSRVEALGGEGGFRLHTTALPFPVAVENRTLAAQGVWVDRAVPALAERFGAVAAVDARFAGRLVVRPAAAGGGMGSTVTTPQESGARPDRPHDSRRVR